jgi:hypothetical protein
MLGFLSKVSGISIVVLLMMYIAHIGVDRNHSYLDAIVDALNLDVQLINISTKLTGTNYNCSYHLKFGSVSERRTYRRIAILLVEIGDKAPIYT